MQESRTNIVFGKGNPDSDILFIGEAPGQHEDEQACIGYLRRQLSVINPKVIVCLGRISAYKIIKPDFKITQEHGKWFKKVIIS